MRASHSGEAAFAALAVLVLLAPRGRGESLFAPPVLAVDPIPADAPGTEVFEAAGAGRTAEPPRQAPVWGSAGFRGYGLGDQIAPNGLEFKALFSLDLDFNFWLWRSRRVYSFFDAQFWGQRAAPGVTNPTQGAFDFSKREFDLSGGAAWNYYGALEARAFAYSFNNLNRGESTWHPSGYNDGVGLENRLYLGDEYAALGTDSYDVSRATFVSAGFYPTKEMVDVRGDSFRPGPFARASLTRDLLGEKCYLYGDFQLLGTRSFTPKVLRADVGLAARPFAAFPLLEFRVGSDDAFDLRDGAAEPGVYGAMRVSY